ncbi:centrosomal protein of 41 kDa [Penaeus vannamei]|uniref:centrosomal protein of 41 kDa n=1 Tax=Penaeus vannamei TaxID=6689 RepID=UPI000F66D81B|nr:centrosomal protein of 41 kDa-like [Penaeus vannamei]
MHSRKFVVSNTGTVNTLKKYSISDREILNKRIKTNPRYSGVRPRTNTGFNTQRRQELELEIRKYYKVRNDEVYRRISLADLLQLMLAHAEDVEAAECDNQNIEKEQETAEVPLKYRDEVENVLHKMTELEMEGRPKPPECPYVIIDIRPSQDYQESHLVTSVNHPASRMSRAVGWECPELLMYKNHSEFIIVVYDDAEDVAPEVAATLQHRGYSNIFMLSGGLRIAKDKFGFPLVTDDTSRILTQDAAKEIAQQVSVTVIPPLSMADASDWWEAASRIPNYVAPTDPAMTTTPSTINTGRQTARSQLKSRDGQTVRPWR